MLLIPAVDSFESQGPLDLTHVSGRPDSMVLFTVFTASRGTRLWSVYLNRTDDGWIVSGIDGLND
jgi:hypothetical protein